jgi:cyclophilin family peptidyl-prolyl cis-trans isomerase
MMVGFCLFGCGDAAVPPASIDGGSKVNADTADRAVKPGSLASHSSNASESNTSAVIVRQSTPAPQPPEVEINTSVGRIVVRLNRDESPVTVENFLSRYVASGFYDETIFHYVDDGNMIAAGGYSTDLKAKTTYGEIFNEARTESKNLKGTIAMARHHDYVNSATSQFFFNLVDNPGLDHEGNEEGQQVGYCVFGEVISGMDVLERIAKVPVKDTDAFKKIPVDPILIQSMKRIR